MAEPAPEERKKRKSLSVLEKMKIFQRMDDHPELKQVEIAREFHISTSSLNLIVKQRSVIEKAAEEGRIKRRRLKGPKHEELERIVAEWLHQNHLQMQGIPIHGSILRAKAKEVAKTLKIDGFTASNGWIDRFRKRHEQRWKSLGGGTQFVQNRLEGPLHQLLKDYSESDTFSADELGLFYNLLPDGNMAYKIESCHGGNRSKERITALLCCNMAGTEKLKPLVIGKPKAPPCFRDVRHFPCDYADQRNAWMTTDEFRKWLKRLDAKMRAENRRILLCINNWPAHPRDLGFLTNVRVEFLSPNTQPLDMGIIRVVKHYYRGKVARQIINALASGATLSPKACRVDLLKAMHFLKASWNMVTPTTIQKCFRKAGFATDITTNQENDSEDISPYNAVLEQDAASYDEVLERWTDIQKVMDSCVTFDEFVRVDDYVPVCDIQGIEDMIELRPQNDQSDESGDDDDEANSTVCRSDAVIALDTLRLFACQSGGEEYLNTISRLENLTARLASSSSRQSISSSQKH